MQRKEPKTPTIPGLRPPGWVPPKSAEALEAALPEHVRARQALCIRTVEAHDPDLFVPAPSPEIMQAAQYQRALQEAGQEVTPFALLQASTLLQMLPPEEQLLRTTFVEQYLYDYDHVLAACRLGYSMTIDPVSKRSEAQLVGAALLREPVVQRLIREYAQQGLDVKERRAQIFTALYREAMSPDTPIQSRIKALGILIESFGWDEKSEEQKRLRMIQEELLASQNNKARGGVMRLPATIDEGTWESVTMSSQERLQADVVD